MTKSRKAITGYVWSYIFCCIPSEGRRYTGYRPAWRPYYKEQDVTELSNVNGTRASEQSKRLHHYCFYDVMRSQWALQSLTLFLKQHAQQNRIAEKFHAFQSLCVISISEHSEMHLCKAVMLWGSWLGVFACFTLVKSNICNYSCNNESIQGKCSSHKSPI